MTDLQLGSKIQAMRMERGLSVRKLASMADITPSMLSQIENEQVNPSINTPRAIAQALNIPLYLLFKDAPVTDPIVHPQNRLTIGSAQEPDVRYELLTGDTNGDIEFCIMVIPPQQDSYRELKSHTGEEVAYMLAGERVELELDGMKHTMHPGDSVRIPPNTPHGWHNPTDTAVQVIFAVTPPTF